MIKYSTASKYYAPIVMCVLGLAISALSMSASAQTIKSTSNNDVLPGRSKEVKSINNTKADVNELTYVANADNCATKALKLPLDHGPRAATTSLLNNQRVSECYGRVR
jgi:hypothetical protein